MKIYIWLIFVCSLFVAAFAGWLGGMAYQEKYRQPSIMQQQQFFNSLNNPRYTCGEEDGVPGYLFKRAAVNYDNDNACRWAIDKMEKAK